MANNFFQFRQFTIHQDNCAMKVCTDACLFGALIAGFQPQVANCLDVGTGTGLLSLMYAQKDKHALIDAVEIDPAAALQARKNFDASPWKERLTIINTNVNRLSNEKKYDLIISNPPFFENNLRSFDNTKNSAKHDSSLTLLQLLKIVGERLPVSGSFAVLLPYHRITYFEDEALLHGLHMHRKVLVRQTPLHELFRGILFFKKAVSKQLVTEMSIKRSDERYTAEFTALLKDYYLQV